jgi:hypothetical protein
MLQGLVVPVSYAREYPSVQIADPYIEMHTGPGRGYPIFNVEERDAWITILKRKTDWFKVRNERGKEGWVKRQQMVLTLSPSGEQTIIEEPNIDGFTRHRWELGTLGGKFENASNLTLYGGYGITRNLSVELSVSKIFSNFADGLMGNLNLVSHPFPNWRVSPFFTLGTGVIRTNPKVTLVQEIDRVDQLGHVGVGARVYLARRFILRAHYKHYVIFQSTNENQEIDEWNVGFAVFF